MKKVLSLLLIIVVAFSFTACGGSGSTSADEDQTWELKVHIEGSEPLRQSQGWLKWADMITEKTDGRVTFKFYWDNTLLDASSEYSQLTAGIADIADMHKYASDGFKIYEKWKGLTLGTPVAAQAEMGKTLYNDFPELQEEMSGVHILAHAFDGGAYQILTVNKKVESVEDMKGLVIWCEADFNDFFKALGATPINTPWSEVYSSLQKNMYDGLFIAAETLKLANFAEVCKYATMVDLNYLAAPGHLMNLDTWNSFPDDIKAVFNDPEVVGYIEDYMATSGQESDATSVEWAQETMGTEIIELSDATKQEFIDVLNESKKSMAEAWDAEGLPGTEILNEIIELSAQYE